MAVVVFYLVLCFLWHLFYSDLLLACPVEINCRHLSLQLSTKLLSHVNKHDHDLSDARVTHVFVGRAVILRAKCVIKRRRDTEADSQRDRRLLRWNR